jgi:FMN-dependent NADH-azoreductase
MSTLPRGGIHSDSLHLARHFLAAVQSATDNSVDIQTLNVFDAGALPEFGRTAAAAKMAVFSGEEQTAEQLQSRPPASGPPRRRGGADRARA